MGITLQNLFSLFFIEIVIDFVTGVLVAGKEGKLKSRSCSNGMFRSIGECIVLGMFMLTTHLIPDIEQLCFTFIIGFVFKEGLSIVENLIKLDVWVPKSLKSMLEVGVDKLDKADLTNSDKEEK